MAENSPATPGLIDRIISVLETASSGPAFDEAILNASFVFEKARGLPPVGWPDQVIGANVTNDDVARLKVCLVNLIERGGRGSWALGNSCDAKLKATYVRVLRREMNGDAGELYQAIIALMNIGECFDEDRHSCSILDEAENRALARKYLESQD